MLDFRVHSFLTLCKYMSYTRAAEELHITQPAVSQHIKFLQDAYKVKLFEYTNQTLILTPEGEMLRDAMITFHRDEHKLRNDLLNISKMKIVHFGATQTIGEFELPPRLISYLKRHPERRVYMDVDNTQALLSRLDDGFLDFLLVEGYFEQTKYRVIPWSTEKFVCVCSPDYELPAGRLKLADLFDSTLILRTPGSGTREILVRNLEAHNYDISDFKKIHEISAIHLIKQLAVSGCGITFIYKKAVEKELNDGMLKEVQLADFDVSHVFSFIWRKGSIYEALIQRMYFELQAPGTDLSELQRFGDD